MDLIMESFALAYVPRFSARELADYEALLNESDPDLYNWITRTLLHWQDNEGRG